MREKLLEFLHERSPQTTLELANKIDASWHTVQETLLEMQIEGRVRRMCVGGRHLWFCDEKKKNSKKRRKSLAGLSSQTRFVAIALIIIVLSQGMITAIDIAGNSTSNFTGEVTLDEQIRTADSAMNSSDNESAAPDILSNASSYDTQPFNSSNITLPANESVAMVNESQEASTAVGTPSDSSLDISIEAPGRVTRSNELAIKATITARADAKNIAITWLLPSGFETVSESSGCSSLQSGQSCVAEILVRSNTSAQLGPNAIKVNVTYES